MYFCIPFLYSFYDLRSVIRALYVVIHCEDTVLIHNRLWVSIYLKVYFDRYFTVDEIRLITHLVPSPTHSTILSLRSEFYSNEMPLGDHIFWSSVYGEWNIPDIHTLITSHAQAVEINICESVVQNDCKSLRQTESSIRESVVQNDYQSLKQIESNICESVGDLKRRCTGVLTWP